MKTLLLLTLLIGFSAKADLYSRVVLEDTLRNRVEDALKVHDKEVRALIRIDYKKFEGVLPGTNIVSEDAFTPVKMESADIARINVEIYTVKKDLNAEAQEMVYKVLPFERSKIVIDIKPVTQTELGERSKLIDAQSLSEIVTGSTQSLINWLMILTVGVLISALGFSFYISNKRMTEFKNQMSLVVKALSESADGGENVKSPWLDMNTAQTQQKSASPESEDLLKKMSLASLKELMADCYWCGLDSYASWVWKKLETQQRLELLNHLSFMKDYSHFIVDLNTAEESYHDHPYYLDPSPLFDISQAQLTDAVQANPGTWHLLSPMRQNTLPLDLEAKLLAVQSKPSKTKIQLSQKSPHRELALSASMGELSYSDEKALFEKPELVPAQLKQQVKSLVWLALQSDEAIQKALSRYDARSLASAWVGPEEVLAKLEKSLPEKKLKILQTYKSKMVPSRHSPVYAQLVNEGLRDDKAAA